MRKEATDNELYITLKKNTLIYTTEKGPNRNSLKRNDEEENYLCYRD